MTETPKRFTLRDLPLAARITLSAFLISIGLGYFSALVQLHFQHSSLNGSPLPTPDDIVERFAGVPNFLTNRNLKPGDQPVSKLERLIMAPEVGLPFNGSGTMSPAFYLKSKDFVNQITKNPGIEPKLREERAGEQLALKAWINADPAEREAAFKKDAFPLPVELQGKPITTKLVADGKVKVASIFEERCASCHGAAGQQGKVALAEYADIAKYLVVPKVGGKSTRQMSEVSLTQSTHVHLLSFSVLWMLTGLIFAFSSYPGWLRLIVSPIVLIAQVVDVCCWWLARLDGVGPYFALAIIGTGTIVGLGLVLQIVLSLFNMYSWKGKAVLLVLFAGAGFGGFILYNNVIEPTLAHRARQVAKE